MFSLGNPRGPFPANSVARAWAFTLELLIHDLPYEFCHTPLTKLVPGMEYKRKNNFLTADLCAGGVVLGRLGPSGLQPSGWGAHGWDGPW